MTNSVAKKEEERACVERALSLLDIHADSIVEQESPDFSVTIDDRVIGLEVVQARTSTGAKAKKSTKPRQGRRLIQLAINKKAKLLTGYWRQNPEMEEMWLLVVAGLGPGGCLQTTDGQGTFRSPFDRTFYLETVSGTCVELTT